jgi:hypothetical protein
MKIQKRENRKGFFILGLGFVFELAICMLIFYFVKSEYESIWAGSLIFFLILQAVAIALWFKNSIWRWLVFYYWGRKEISDNFFNFLKNNNFPEPDEYVPSVDDYLAQTASNKNLDPEVRIAASSALGELAGTSNSGSFQNKIRILLAFEDGLLNYKTNLKQ